MSRISMHVFVMAAFLVTSLNCCMAETYTANIEKFKIEVTSEEAVDFYDQFPPASYPDFTANLVQMWVGNDLFETVIMDYGSSTNVSEKALVRANQVIYPLENQNKKSWVYTDIGGQKGFIADVQVAASIPQFEMVYSPDASGNQGTIIVTITAYTADKKKVEDVLKALKIHRSS
ncbi:Uncharacterised protein [uncultured archaeon]|nr:Uncharacterised protein [uncultured archaeon]